METHKINTITYGQRIDTSVNMMVDGMIELFDDFCDLTLSRVCNQANESLRGFNIEAFDKKEISRFKLAWLICLSELMFYSMQDQPKLADLRNGFRTILDDEAKKRSLQTFTKQAFERILIVIHEDLDFVENEIFNTPTGNRELDKPRNRGLGPTLARLILENAFGENRRLQPIYNDILEVIETELNNAYGHCSIACSKFNVI